MMRGRGFDEGAVGEAGGWPWVVVRVIGVHYERACCTRKDKCEVIAVKSWLRLMKSFYPSDTSLAAL